MTRRVSITPCSCPDRRRGPGYEDRSQRQAPTRRPAPDSATEAGGPGSPRRGQEGQRQDQAMVEVEEPSSKEEHRFIMETSAIWVSCGEGATLPSGVFRDLSGAEAWIEEYALTGIRAEDPLDVGVYDGARSRGWFRPRSPSRQSPELMGGFSGADLEHFHFENGERRARARGDGGGRRAVGRGPGPPIRGGRPRSASSSVPLRDPGAARARIRRGGVRDPVPWTFEHSSIPRRGPR